ncbi:MAG: hypothetical protein QOF02_2896 [Blastocatellia bacterium]|jgi:hypothetical protein|nr:hypothetical protein [Blastocatellia bacterium]
MKRFLTTNFTLAALFLLIVCPATGAFGQQPAKTSQLTSGTPSAAEVERIIKAFSAKETEFRHALNSYAFKRDAVIQEIGMGGQIAGEYHRVSNFSFDNEGKRFEKITFFPIPTFPGVTAEDIEDLSGVNPFALEQEKISQYNFAYAGKEQIDELTLHVFDVTPKMKLDPNKSKDRYFIGRIWVDDRDYQIVKSKGKGVPETKDNKFPIVETYREQIDGRYWFPTYSYADEDLVYDNGFVMHIRIRVRYTDFHPGRASVKIIEDDGVEVQDEKPKPTPTPSPTPAKP